MAYIDSYLLSALIKIKIKANISKLVLKNICCKHMKQNSFYKKAFLRVFPE